MLRDLPLGEFGRSVLVTIPVICFSLAAFAGPPLSARLGEERGLLGAWAYTELPLVSGDYIGDPHSSTFDATMTQLMGDKFAKVFAWYDNEWGFSNRMVELSQLVAAKL